MPKLENPQHEIFVMEIVKGSAQLDAYRAAGYKPKTDAAASAAASRLLTDVKIKARLEELLTKREEKATSEAALTLEDHMAKLRQLRDAAEAEGKFDAAIKAEVKRGELRRFYVKQVENGGPGEFSDVTDDQLDDMIEELIQQRLAARH